MITLVARYFTAVVGPVIGFFLVASPYLVAEWLDIDLPMATCKDAIIVPLLLGVPLGTGMALCVGNRYFHKSRSWCLEAGGAAVFVAVAGVLVGILLMDEYDSWAIGTIPFLSALVSAPAYHLIEQLFSRSARPAE